MDEKLDEIKIEDELQGIDLYSEQESVSERRNFKVELILIFILGLLLGMVVKTEAAKKITMGFNDYKVLPLKNDYDFKAIEKKLVEEQKASQAAAVQEQALQQ